MARIIGGIGTSHVPTIGLAYDKKRQEKSDRDPVLVMDNAEVGIEYPPDAPEQGGEIELLFLSQADDRKGKGLPAGGHRW